MNLKCAEVVMMTEMNLVFLEKMIEEIGQRMNYWVNSSVIIRTSKFRY